MRLRKERDTLWIVCAEEQDTCLGPCQSISSLQPDHSESSYTKVRGWLIQLIVQTSVCENVTDSHRFGYFPGIHPFSPPFSVLQLVPIYGAQK